MKIGSIVVCVVSAVMFWWGSSAGGNVAARPTMRSEVTIQVEGNVDAMLIDQKGRKTGWNPGRVEDIPGCRVDMLEDEIAAPMEYTFHLTGRTGMPVILCVIPRTRDSVEVAVRAALGPGKPCTAGADTLLGIGEHRWRISWSAGRGGCHASIRTVPPSPVGDSDGR